MWMNFPHEEEHKFVKGNVYVSTVPEQLAKHNSAISLATFLNSVLLG